MLSKAQIDALPGDGKTIKDDRIHGLVLRDGARLKTWYYIKKVDGQVKKIKLGEWPDMGISAARQAAQIEGTNITTKRQPVKYCYTVRDVFDNWAERRVGVKKSLKEDFRKMDHDLAEIASINILEVSSEHISELKKRMKNTPVAFNRCLSLLRSIFNHARDVMELDIPNAAKAIPKNPEKPRSEKIPFDKASAFFDALNAPGRDQHFVDIVKILLYTGQRKGNVFAMEWSELDLDAAVWVIPAEKSKNGKKMPTVLSPEVVAILRRRQQEHSGGPWVFPVLRRAWTVDRFGRERQAGAGHVSDIRGSYTKLLQDAGLPQNLTIHDLRRTCGTWMLSAGASIEQVSTHLHHEDIRITQQVYAEMLLQPVRDGVDLMRSAITKSINDSEKSKK